MKTLVKITVVFLTLVMMFVSVPGCRKGYYRDNYYGDYGFVYWNGQPYCRSNYDEHVSRYVWHNYWRPSPVFPPNYSRPQCGPEGGDNYWRPSPVFPPNYSRPQCGPEGGGNYWRPSPVCPPNYYRPCPR